MLTRVKGNLELLSGSGKLMLDSNGDGKPDTPLDEAQRVAQKALAEAASQGYLHRHTVTLSTSSM